MKKLTIVILFFSVFMLTGCWDRYELEERANILGLAVDVIEDEEEKKELQVTHEEGDFPEEKRDTYYRITAQIAVPGKIQLGPEGGAEDSKDTSWVLETYGHTVKDAMASLQQQLAGKLYLGHLQIVVVSDTVAEKGIEDINDYLRRDHEVRRTAWIVINKEDASRVLETAPPLETIPALYISDTLENAVRFGKLPREYLGRFWIDLSDAGIDAVLPAIKVINEDRIMVDGLSYFQGERVVGRTNAIEIGALMALKEKNAEEYSLPVTIEGNQGVYTVKSSSSKSKIDLSVKKGSPSATINVTVDAIIEEEVSTNNLNAELLSKIEKEAGKKMEKISKQLIQDFQNNQSDVLGLGARLRAKHASYWDSQIKDNVAWAKEYSEMKVDVNFDYNIERPGIKWD